MGRVEVQLGRLAAITVLTGELESLREPDVPFCKVLSWNSRLRQRSPGQVRGDLRVIPEQSLRVLELSPCSVQARGRDAQIRIDLVGERPRVRERERIGPNGNGWQHGENNDE